MLGEALTHSSRIAPLDGVRAVAAYGVKEAQSGGTDPASTILRADYTSKWGIMLATGNMWVWARSDHLNHE